MRSFVQDLEDYVDQKLSSLDLLKEPAIGSVDPSEIVRRLKIALKNELEASEIAALWMPTTLETEVKLALARQVGDEAKHYRLIEQHLEYMGVDLRDFNPGADGCFSCWQAFRRRSSASAPLNSPASRLH